MSPFIRVLPCLVAMLFVVVIHSRAGAQTESPGVTYESGFYNEEFLKDTSWRWMDAEGVVKLKNGRQDMVLKMTGRAPLDAKSPTMNIYLNGEQLEQFTPSEKLFEKVYKVPAAKMGDGAWSELKITTTKVIVPSQVNIKLTDDRTLGFKLYSLTWLNAAGEPVAPVARVAPPSDPGTPAPKEPAPSSKGWLAALLLAGLVSTLLLAIAIKVWVYPRQRSSAAEPAKKRDKPRPKSPEA